MLSSNEAGAALADVVTSAARRRLYLRAGWWTPETLPDRVARHAARADQALAVVDRLGERQVDYGTLHSDAGRVAGWLRAVGVQPGEVVAVQMPNWYETVVVDLALLGIGAVLNPLLPIYRANELRHMLALPSTRVIVTPAEYHGFDYRPLVDELRSELPALEHHLVVPDPSEGGDFPAADGAHALTDLARDAAGVSELMYTSGTEAAPKAIMHTEQTTNAAVRAAAASLGLALSDVVWMPSPIGHSTGLNYGVRMALFHGLPLVLQDRWNADDALRLIDRFRPTYTVAATTFLADLVDRAIETDVDLGSLRLFSSGGAPVPRQLVEAAHGTGMGVLRLYGSTEALVATWNRPDSPAEQRVSTDGCPLDGVELETRDDGGRAVVGEPGEIFVRGPSTSVGFYRDPERTVATFDAGGWVRSGDLGVLDAEGYLTIVGRKKEIIIRGGMNIAPREIEDLIRQMPEVSAVAVVGVPDPRLGEVACACVVAQPALTLGRIAGFLRQQGLATYKLPQRLVHLEALPVTQTGKVRKFELVQAITAGAVAIES